MKQSRTIARRRSGLTAGVAQCRPDGRHYFALRLDAAAWHGRAWSSSRIDVVAKEERQALGEVDG